jgi:hypothetical protein
MFPISFRTPIVMSMVLVVVAMVLAAQSAVAGAATSAISLSHVQPLAGGKPLVSGRVNVIPVRLPFGFAVFVRNKSRDGHPVVIKLRVKFERSDQPAYALRAVMFLAPERSGTARIVGKPSVAFAQRASLTVSVSDRARRTTAVRHYAVIFALG